MADTQEVLGEQLYAEISKSHPELAGKLTGMVLQLGVEECRGCLEDADKLRGAVNEAMKLLDSSGGVTAKAKPDERRVDPEDGKVRTFRELSKECQGKYTLKEIEEYWATMKVEAAAPSDQNSEAPEKPAKAAPPMAQSRSPQGMPVAKPKKAPEKPAKKEAKDDVEAVAGLRIFLAQLKLEKYYDAAAQWCDENGAANLNEIIENCEDFATGVALKKVEKNRLEKTAGSARDKACDQDPAAREANPVAVKPAQQAKAKEEEIPPPVVSAVAPPVVPAAVAPPASSEDNKPDGVEISVSIESVDDLKEAQSRLAEKMQNLGINQDQVADAPVTIYVSAGGKTTSVTGPEDMEDLDIPGKMKFALKFKKQSDKPSKGSNNDNLSKDEGSKENVPPNDTPEWCSFNQLISPEMKNFLKPTDDQLMDMIDEDPKLNTTWWLWEQIAQSNDKGASFEGSLRKFASFSTVRKFWAFWNHLPQPSELLQKKKFIREDGGNKNIVEGLMIFRDGVKPAWEDPVNASGGHFQIQLRPDIGGGQIDECWNNIVMGMVLDDIKPSEMITGLRLVDKLKGKRMDAVCIRIEVWFSDVENKDAVDQLKRNLNLCLTTKLDGGRGSSSGLKIDVKSHITKK